MRKLSYHRMQNITRAKQLSYAMLLSLLLTIKAIKMRLYLSKVHTSLTVSVYVKFAGKLQKYIKQFIIKVYLIRTY